MAPTVHSIMQTKSNLGNEQMEALQEEDEPSTSRGDLPKDIGDMISNLQLPDIHCSSSSGTTTPNSTRSSLSYESAASSLSSVSRPQRSSLRPNLKRAASEDAKSNRKSLPAMVRFVEPAPAPKSRPVTMIHQPKRDVPRMAVASDIPDSMRSRPRPASFSAGSTTSRQSLRPPVRTAQSFRGVKRLQLDPIQDMETATGQSCTSPPKPAHMDRRWSGVPQSTNFSLPSRPRTTRASSFRSVRSDMSVQSAPAAVQTPKPSACPPGQYNAFEHYIPCLYTGCQAHYTDDHIGPTYYLPQEPYSLSRQQGFCPEHAASELKEANEACKLELENLRQNAGRQTLRQISKKFDLFLEATRNDRRAESMDLLRQQKEIVLGAVRQPATASSKGKVAADHAWDWRYTPRPCTKTFCNSVHYSPFSKPFYEFYMTVRPSGYFPLHTLCPKCSGREVEALESNIQIKRMSRCGWDESEWTEWLEGAIQERNAGMESATEAQERIMKLKGPSRWVERMAAAEEAQEKATAVKETQKKKSFLKRLFSRSSKSGAKV